MRFSRSCPFSCIFLRTANWRQARLCWIFEENSWRDFVNLLATARFLARFEYGSQSGSGGRLPAALFSAAGCWLLCLTAASLIPQLTHLSNRCCPQTQWLDGHWMLAPPPRPTQAAQSASRTLALKLLQLVMADAETRDIEAVLRQDPTLSYHLLRLVNSLGIGVGREITSFAQAILILGRNQLRRWLNLMLFAARSDDYRSSMLLARWWCVPAPWSCWPKRADWIAVPIKNLAFMTGMFSMLGVLFGSPLSELIQPLQLSDELVGAVIQAPG